AVPGERNQRRPWCLQLRGTSGADRLVRASFFFFSRGPTSMKRYGALLASLFLGSIFVGCDSGGIKEGSPEGPVSTSQTDQFRKSMEQTGNKMMKKGPGQTQNK